MCVEVQTPPSALLICCLLCSQAEACGAADSCDAMSEADSDTTTMQSCVTDNSAAADVGVQDAGSHGHGGSDARPIEQKASAGQHAIRHHAL